MNKISILFVGTSDFAVYSLEAILKSQNFDVVGVITQPDRPAGRKQILEMPDVKKFLIENKHDVPIFQPEKIKLEWENILNSTNPDVIVTASYGQILPKGMIEFPKHKAINIHASLLPKWRGAVPMNMSILHGDITTGVAFQLMSMKMDEGNILMQTEIQIAKDETTLSLTEKLGKLSAENINKVIIDWVNGKIDPINQDHTQATYCYKEDITKDKAQILPDTNLITADRMIRAFYPWPIAWITVNGENGFEGQKNIQNKKLQIHKAIMHNEDKNMAGKLFRKNKTIFVGLKDGALEILEAKLEGKGLMSGKEYLFLA